MASKSRLARLLMPRFGTAWLFVGMLLLISAAGWWKFHRDLYVEEQRAILKLNETVGSFSVAREQAGLPWLVAKEEADDEIPWNAPLLPPIERIDVEGEAPKETRDLIVGLPRLKTFTQRLDLVQPFRGQAKQPHFDFEGHLDRSLPELPQPMLTVAALDVPLAAGEEVEPADAARIASEIRDAWTSGRTPRRFLVVSRSDQLGQWEPPYGPQTHVHLVEPDRRYHYYVHEDQGSPERAILLVDGYCYDLRGIGSTWRRESRDATSDSVEHDEVFRGYPHDDFPYIGADLHGWQMVSRALEAMPTFQFDRIAMVDEVRYRVDFKPFSAPRDEEDALSHGIDPRVVAWNCIVRSDLDWVPEESKLVQDIQYVPATTPTRYERRTAQRYDREGGAVVLTERLEREGSHQPAGFDERVLTRHVYARESDPRYDVRIFDPLALDPEPWPERRELPWLPWHRLTFLLGCGLAAMLIGRRFMPKRSKAEASGVPRESDAEVTTTT